MKRTRASTAGQVCDCVNSACGARRGPTRPDKGACLASYPGGSHNKIAFAACVRFHLALQ